MKVPEKRNRAGVGGVEEVLPSLYAHDTVTGQAPHLRRFNDYSKTSQKRHEREMAAMKETEQLPSQPNILAIF